VKRYFDIPKDRLTLQLNLTPEGMIYTVEKIEKSLKITGLREVSLREYKRLSNEYTKPQNTLVSNDEKQLSFV